MHVCRDKDVLLTEHVLYRLYSVFPGAYDRSERGCAMACMEIPRVARYCSRTLYLVYGV